jgi:Putative porin
MQFGMPKLEKRGDWSAWFDYRQVGSDAVIDGLNEDDLGGGGTNMKGYTLGAQVALSKRVSIGARWFSASELAGPPLKSDIFMLDLQANF